MKKIIKGAAGQLGKLVLDTAVKTATEPLGLDELAGSSSPSGQSPSPSQAAANKPNIAQMLKNDQVQSGAEMEALRKQLGQTDQASQGGGVRNVEREIQEVRAKKKQLFEEKEKELLAQLEEKRKEEEVLAQQDALPVSSRPQRGSALSRGKGKKGTKETDMRRSV